MEPLVVAQEREQFDDVLTLPSPVPSPARASALVPSAARRGCPATSGGTAGARSQSAGVVCTGACAGIQSTYGSTDAGSKTTHPSGGAPTDAPTAGIRFPGP